MKFQGYRGIFLVFVATLMLLACVDAERFPGRDVQDFGRHIAKELPRFEGSSVVVHPGIEGDPEAPKVVVTAGDSKKGGKLVVLNLDSTIRKVYSLDGDVEALTVADESEYVVFVAFERRLSVAEIDLRTGKTVREFDLSTHLHTAKKNKGIEAMAFDPHTGYFFVGLQHSSQISVFDFGLKTGGTGITLIDSGIPSFVGSTDLSGMSYNRYNKEFYLLYDKIAKIYVVNILVNHGLKFEKLREWSFSHDKIHEEGIFVDGCGSDATMYLANDDERGTPKLYRYRLATVKPCLSLAEVKGDHTPVETKGADEEKGDENPARYVFATAGFFIFGLMFLGVGIMGLWNYIQQKRRRPSVSPGLAQGAMAYSDFRNMSDMTESLARGDRTPKATLGSIDNLDRVESPPVDQFPAEEEPQALHRFSTGSVSNSDLRPSTASNPAFTAGTESQDVETRTPQDSLL